MPISLQRVRGTANEGAAARVCEAGEIEDDELEAPDRESRGSIPADDESETGGLVQVRGTGRPDVSGGQRPGHRNRLGWQLEDLRRQVPL